MKPKKIIVHHSLTKDSETVSWGAIRRYHMYDRAWSDIGYHAGCEMVGSEVECFYGRPDDYMGAHTRGHNRDSLGFLFVGNYDIVEPDPMMLAVAAARVLAPWCRVFDIDPRAIHGHRDFSTKMCPGELFHVELLQDIVISEMET